MLFRFTTDKEITFLTTNVKSYIVTNSGKVYSCEDGIRTRLPIQDYHVVVEGEDIKLANILNFAFKGNVAVGWDDLKQREITFVDDDPTNFQLSNMFWNTGNAVDDEEGFRLIPGYSRYRISKEGVVRNVERNSKQSSYVDKYGYTFFGMTPDVGKRLPIGAHRLMGFSFLHIPKDFYKYDINHDNGIKSDNSIGNLEWCTRRHNVEHAIRTGLRGDNHPVLVRNIKTGEVVEFYSIGSCETQLGLGKNTVNMRVRSKGQTTYSDYCQFCLKSDFTQWGKVDLEKHLHRSGVPQVIKLTYKKTGEFVLFESIAALSKHIGLKNGTLSYRLNRNPPRWEDENYIFEKQLSLVPLDGNV